MGRQAALGGIVKRLRPLAIREIDVKLASTLFAITGVPSITAGSALGQAPQYASPVKNVSRTTKAVNYRRGGGSTRIDFQGTELMQQASGEAKFQNKASRTEINPRFLGLAEATKFAL